MDAPSTTNVAPGADAVACHRCGYDLRSQPADGVCPECGEPVAESIRLAAIPVRPAWRDSDPRWRRRMLAGVWVLTLLPMVHLFQELGWSSHIPVPELYDSRSVLHTLQDTLLLDWIDPWPTFVVGVVLLFAKERFRRRRRRDWTRRWGVLFSYLMLILGGLFVMPVISLVAMGIAALFFSLPLENQPGATNLFVWIGGGYGRTGLTDIDIERVATATAVGASVTVSLACVPLFDSLRASMVRRPLALVLVLPLLVFSLLNIVFAGFEAADAGWKYGLGPNYYYFSPYTTVQMLLHPSDLLDVFGLADLRNTIEFSTWVAVALIALWLTLAQIRSWRRLPVAA